MTSQDRSLLTRWLASRLHPLARYGYDVMRTGARTGHDGETWAGAAMLITGLAIQRRRRKRLRRRPIYRADLGEDAATEIRVLQSGGVVGEVEIPAGES